MLTLFVALAVVLALGHLAALVGILFRYAIPRAPRAFHFVLAPAMIGAAIALLGVAQNAASGEGLDLFGVEILVFRLAYIAFDIVTWWTLIFYAVYHQLRGGHRCPM